MPVEEVEKATVEAVPNLFEVNTNVAPSTVIKQSGNLARITSAMFCNVVMPVKFKLVNVTAVPPSRVILSEPSSTALKLSILAVRDGLVACQLVALVAT